MREKKRKSKEKENMYFSPSSEGLFFFIHSKILFSIFHIFIKKKKKRLKVVIENQEGKSDVQLVGQTSFGHHQSSRVYSPDGLSIAINTCTPPQILNIQKERNKANEFVGIGHHPFSKKLEFNTP